MYCCCLALQHIAHHLRRGLHQVSDVLDPLPALLDEDVCIWGLLLRIQDLIIVEGQLFACIAATLWQKLLDALRFKLLLSLSLEICHTEFAISMVRTLVWQKWIIHVFLYVRVLPWGNGSRSLSTTHQAIRMQCFLVVEYGAIIKV